MHVKKFTEDFRHAELERGKGSLFYFNRAILGFDRLGPLQWDLCRFLEGAPPHYPWNRALVCVYRGGFKSTCTTQGLPLWRVMYIVDFAVKLIENSSDNVKRNHFMPMIELFTSARRADYLRWLFQHRFPANMAGTNSEQLKLVQDNPLAAPAISYWGNESKFEGWHGNLVVCDDLEGADADVSDVPNEASWRTYQRCIPLLEEPRRDQLLVVGTPHGDNPIVFRLRDRELRGEIDNGNRAVKVFWKPVLDDHGEPYEPHRFPKRLIKELRLEPMFDQQYLLLKRRSSDVVFDPHAIAEGSFEYTDASRKVIRYRSFEFDLDKLSEEGFAIPDPVDALVSVDELRKYIHVDPTHRLDEQMRSKKDRPSRGAIVVVGVAPDGHVFPLELWSENADIGDLAQEVIRLARRWNVYKITFEAIGAQVWFTKFIENYERMARSQQMRAIRDGSLGVDSMRVSLNSKIEEANKGITSKEWLFRERLAPYVNRQVIHFHPQYHHRIITQLLNVNDEMQEIDLIDALSQGPEIWEPPVHETMSREDRTMLRRAYVETYAMKRTGFISPYRSRIPKVAG